MDKLLFDYRTISKAKRVLLFFKPREIVQCETFDLELTFRNFGERFCGGSFYLYLDYPMLHLRVPLGKAELPSIDEGQSSTIRKEGLIASFGSNCVLKLTKQIHSENGQEVISNYLYSSLGEIVRDESSFPLPITTKEELYQKYSVIVALWTATISIIISALGILFSVLRR